MSHITSDGEMDICSIRDNILKNIKLPLEIRVHGRGGQGGVTCAKLCALVFSGMGLFAQTFGDYGMERAGAPVRAYTRVDRNPIKNRNKVYKPDHLLVLDGSLFGAAVLEGVNPGSLILLNTAEDFSAFSDAHKDFGFATVNAVEIARKFGIGTSAVVIVNTTIVGAYARIIGLPFEILEETYASLGLQNDMEAAREAYHSVSLRETTALPCPSAGPTVTLKSLADVIPIPELTVDMPTLLKTGSWRTQTPIHENRQAPCNAACPAGNDVVGFIQALKQEGMEAAAKILLSSQPLPSVCGRVCPAPCMASCNRAGYDGAVNIRSLERLIGDGADENSLQAVSARDSRRIAVVGGGPAGLGASFVLMSAGHDVTLYESLTKPGGLLRSVIPRYRLPDEALDGDIRRLYALGLKTECGTALDSRCMEKLLQEYDAVILATGQALRRSLGFSTAPIAGFEQGLDFLSRVKILEGTKLDGHVIVLGGGNTAVDCARTALRCGASKVTIAYRRGREEMPAIAEEIEEAVAEGVKILYQRQPTKFIGDKRLTGIELSEVDLGEPDSDGRRRPTATSRLNVLPCDYVLSALGQESDLKILSAEWAVMNSRVYHSGRTTNLWSAGDFATGEGTVAHAVGHGKKIAREVVNFLENKNDVAQDSVQEKEIITLEQIRLFHFPSSPSRGDRHSPIEGRTRDFQEVNLGPADAEEAERCFSCGHCTRCDTCLIYCPEGIIDRTSAGYEINGEYCKGCGICVWECPRHAMEMTAQGYRS